MGHLKVVHRTVLSPNCRVLVGLVYNKDVVYKDRRHSNYMVLVLIDDESGKWFVVRLKAWRKLVKFMKRKRFTTARRMTWWEKLRTKRN